MKSILVILVLLTATCGQAVGQSLKGAPIDPDLNGTARPSDQAALSAPKNIYMATMSVPGDRSLKYGCRLQFDFNNTNGKVEEVRLLRSSGKPDLDFDCICAVLGSAPYEANERGDHKNILHIFGGRDVSADAEGIKSTNRAKRSEVYSNLPNADYFLCNVIPISLKYRYPEAFTDDELCDLQNIRMIRKTFFAKNNEPTFATIASNERLRTFYDRWSEFIASHKTTSKQEIEKFRDGVVSEFSDMFLPLPNSISKR